MITEQTEEILLDKIRDLQNENREVKNRLESYEDFSRFQWLAQSEMPDDRGLPVPRLEVEWTNNGYDDIATYRLVIKRAFRFGDSEIWSFPLGRTKCSSRGTTKGLDMPIRDGLHIRLEMASLGLRGFMVRGETIIELTPENDPYVVRVAP